MYPVKQEKRSSLDGPSGVQAPASVRVMCRVFDIDVIALVILNSMHANFSRFSFLKGWQ